MSHKLKSQEIKYSNLKSQNEDISNQRKSLEEKLVNLQGKEKQNYLRMNTLSNDISNFISEKKKFEEDKIDYEAKISNLEEEIKTQKDRFNNQIKKITEENDQEKM